MMTKNGIDDKISNHRTNKKKIGAWIDKFSGLLPKPEDRVKNEKQWGLLTVNSTHRVDELLMDFLLLLMQIYNLLHQEQ
jgi:hypothetical protein